MRHSWRDTQVGLLVLAILIVSLHFMMPGFRTWWQWALGACLLAAIWFVAWPYARRVLKSSD